MDINDKNVGYFSIYREPEVAYIELNKNIPQFTKDEIERGLKSSFDEYCATNKEGFGIAFACIDKDYNKEYYKDTMPQNIRKNKKPIILSGNKIEKTKYVDGGFLFNRCHLIGLQFRPSEIKNENIIIGTRYFNIDGMLPFENKVRDYIDKGGRILYRVKPYFKRNNQLADGVQMEALSIDNEVKEELRFNVFVYNKQPGIVINYENGNSHMDESWTKMEDRLNNEFDCIFNINTKKIHKINCACQKQEDKNFYPGIIKILKDKGDFCKNCYPKGNQ